MSETERTPIFDKNGKATHVHKGVTSVPNTRAVATVPPVVVDEKAKVFPNITELHAYNCQCPSCEAGASIGYYDWYEKATVGDVVAFLKAPDWIPEDENPEGLVTNSTGENKFDVLFSISFDNRTTADFVRRMEEAFMDELKRGTDVMSAHAGDSRYNDEYLAVDPENCGCTECIIGEYVPQRNWEPISGDIYNVITGDITNNTFYTDFGLAFRNYPKDSSAREFIKELENEFDRTVAYINVDELAERAY